jgi:hypothetical protein
LISGILNTIILFGALQGFIISCLLFFSGKRKQADRLLGMLIFLLTLASLNVWLNRQAWFQSGFFQTLDVLIPLVVIMPVGPILYFYQCAVLDPEFKLTKTQRLHFAPVLIDLVPSITVIGFILGMLTGLAANHPGPVGYFIDTYNIYADIPRWLSIAIYLALSIHHLRQYRKLNERITATGPLKWLRQLQAAFIAFQLISLCYLIPYVLPAYTMKMVRVFYWYPIYVPLALLIYWLSIKGYLQRQHAVSNKTERQSMRSDIIEKTTVALQKAMETDRPALSG